MAPVILLINPNASQAAELQQHIQRDMRLRSVRAANGEEALKAMWEGAIPQPDVVLLNIGKSHFPLDTIRAIRNFRNDVQVVTMLDYAQVETAMESVTHGAMDFLLMPFHPLQLTTTIRNALSRKDLQIEARQAWAGMRVLLEDIKAQSALLKATLFMAKSLAQNNSPLILEGEQGTGRELLARAMHNCSPRREQAFTSINASLYSIDDIILQLHEESGTLFIRNMDSLPREALQTFLHAIKDIAPTSKGRLMFAMHDAAYQPESKHENINAFFSSLNAVPMLVPCLREIPEDIAMLAVLCCHRYAACEGKLITGISSAAKQMLCESPWPGNMEQLSQRVFHAVMSCKSHELQVEDFRYMSRSFATEITYAPERKAVSLQCVDDAGDIKRLQDVENEMIRYALKRYNGHMSDIARYLGIGRSTLYRKISSMGVSATPIAPARTRRLGQ